MHACIDVSEPLLLHNYTDLVYFLLSEADHDYDQEQQQQAGRHQARPHQPPLRPGQLCKHRKHAAFLVLLCFRDHDTEVPFTDCTLEK